ncbi:hypothetical protein CMI37_17910 [Candidatus Pacearchaeota archaeon]|nr:hypothetical protein [Candidatus Pacearchaeota archaeon]
MRLNDQKLKYDMLGDLVIDECPGPLKEVAQNLCRMLNVTKAPDYNTMTELDKRLTLMFWEGIENLNLYHANLGEFEEWYVKRATNPDLISRARRWLVENRYIIVKPTVAENAQAAGDRWKGATSG